MKGLNYYINLAKLQIFAKLPHHPHINKCKKCGDVFAWNSGVGALPDCATMR